MLFARKYRSWYGRAILIYFIIFIYIIINFILYFAVLAAHFLPGEQFDRFRRGNTEWWRMSIRIAFFFIPVLHSIAIIYLYSVRKLTESRVLEERGARKTAKGKEVLKYGSQHNKPQDDDIEKKLFNNQKELS